MNDHTTRRGGTTNVVSTHSVFGAPCWVSLTSRDLDATEEFYGAVLGWRWRSATLGDRFRMAMVEGTPVAGIAGVATMWQMAVAWTPDFAVPSADEAGASEQTGTAQQVHYRRYYYYNYWHHHRHQRHHRHHRWW